MADETVVEKTPLQKVFNALGKLWTKTQDGCATELDHEVFAALQAAHDELIRVESRIRHAKDKLDGAKSWLDGDWG